MRKNELVEAIKRLETELIEELDNNGCTKRAAFLEATLNVYNKKLCGLI